MPHTFHFLLSLLYLGQCYTAFPLRIKTVKKMLRWREIERLKIYHEDRTGLIERLYM